LFKPVDPKILLAKVRTFITLHDQQRQLAGQLAHIEAVTARLSESLRLHEMFVAALNHDLRTPLHTISLGVQMLDEQFPEQHTLIRRVGAATERMEQMIDQLYDVARTRLGEGIQVERSAVDLAQVVEAVVREAELRSDKRTLRFEARGDTRGCWDRPRISRVAANLIANALMHGAAGTPITVGIDGSNSAEVRLTVHNGGQIPPDVLPQIFEPFRRGTTGKTPGLGLGLYIVREITLAHGGRVNVTSTAQQGTLFEIVLPRGSVAASGSAA
jgi:two-component system sensor histidine kinase/response regulator